MTDNIFQEWLGLDLKQGKEVLEQVEEKRKEIAVAITKLSEYPEWEVFNEELERLKKEFDKPSEFYAVKPDFAKFDAGSKSVIKTIQSFVKNQKLIIEKYAQEKTTNK